MTPDLPPNARPVAGILWMLAAGLCFVVMTALVKSMGQGMHPIQSAFLRYLFGIVFLLPALRQLVWEVVRQPAVDRPEAPQFPV